MRLVPCSDRGLAFEGRELNRKCGAQRRQSHEALAVVRGFAVTLKRAIEVSAKQLVRKQNKTQQSKLPASSGFMEVCYGNSSRTFTHRH